MEALIAVCLSEDPAARPSAKDLVGLLAEIPASLVLTGDTPTATAPSGVACSLAEGSENPTQGLGISDLVGRGADGGFDRLSASAPVLRSGGADPLDAALGAAARDADAPPATPASRPLAGRVGFGPSISAPPGMRPPSAERSAPPLGVITSGDALEAAASSASSDRPGTDAAAAAGAERAEGARGGALGGCARLAGEARRGRALCDSAYGSADEQGGCSAAAADARGEGLGSRVPGCTPADAPDEARLPDAAPGPRRRAPPRILSPFAAPGGPTDAAEPPGRMAAELPARSQADGGAPEQALLSRRRPPPRVPSPFAEAAGAAAPGAGGGGAGPSQAAAAVAAAGAQPAAGAASSAEAAGGAVVAPAAAPRQPPPRIASPFAAPHDATPPPQAPLAVPPQPHVGGSSAPKAAPAAGFASGSAVAGHEPARRQPPPRIPSPFAAPADAAPPQAAAAELTEQGAAGARAEPAAGSASAGAAPARKQPPPRIVSPFAAA